MTEFFIPAPTIDELMEKFGNSEEILASWKKKADAGEDVLHKGGISAAESFFAEVLLSELSEKNPSLFQFLLNNKEGLALAMLMQAMRETIIISGIDERNRLPQIEWVLKELGVSDLILSEEKIKNGPNS
jgi:hypothetical protein